MHVSVNPLIQVTMSIWGKMAGAAAGLALGGPIGALLGGVAGHFLDRQIGATTEIDDPTKKSVAFTIGVIALGAKMAKADGVVSADEVSAFKQVFRVPPAEMKNVARVFDLAKRDIAGFESYASQLAQLFADDRQLLENVLEGLFHIACADTVLHPSEDQFLAEVTRIFGFDAPAYATIKARFVGEQKADPYAVLGIARSTDDETLKRHYRRLVIENHPDKAIARGLPKEFVHIATEKLSAINAAYDAIRRERGLP
jgi:DnaJ like chaperone protein